MDRKNVLVQRTREYYGDRLDDVLHMVTRDRQEMKGWQEPPHLRATVRRAVREEGQTTPTTRGSDTATEEANRTYFEFGRTAGEPDRGQQREAIGVLLETGANALEKIIRNNTDLTPEETFGLETVLLLYARPSLLVQDDQLASVPPFWNILEDEREDIELTQRGVGRIELLGHPELDWAGTGFLVTDNLLLTTRRTAEVFSEINNNNWQFRPGITTWMDFRSDYQNVSTAGCRVRGVFGVHETYDLALLEVEGPQLNGNSPTPIPLLGNPNTFNNNFYNRPIYLTGYPIRDARRNEPEIVSRIFRDVYNVKRVQPGLLRGEFRFSNIPFLRHDAAPLGITAGSPIVDLETHLVVGIQLSGRYLDTSTAVPVYALRDDPLFRRANVPFADGPRRQQTEQTVNQLERLARTRFWNEAQTVIEQLYRRAFGK